MNYFHYLCELRKIIGMSDSQKYTGTRKSAPQPRGKTVAGRIGRAFLWIAGIWLALLLLLQITLSPAILGKIVDKFASEYIDGDLKFDRIGVDMFRHFPYVGVRMENVSLTYPADRFDRLEASGPQGQLMYHGCGTEADTLASFGHFSAGVDIASLLAKKIHISHVILTKPRIYAHSYDEGSANWNMFRFGESDDSSSMRLPHIGIGRIRLTEHPHIVYTSGRDTLFSIIDVKSIAFDGKLDSRKSHKNKIGLKFDSLMVAGRIAADTIGLNMDLLHIHEHNDHMDIDARAKALLATRAFGRIHIPISVKGTAAFEHEPVPSIAMRGFKAEVAAIPIDFDLDLRKEGGIYAEGKFDIRGCRAEDMIDGFIKNIIPEAGKVKTDAALSLSGTCSGHIAEGKLPSVNAVLTIPESTVSHKDIRHEIRLAMDAELKTDENKRIDITLDHAELNTYGLAMKGLGGVEDLLGDDPTIRFDGKFRASADSLLTFFPKNSGIIAEGALSADLKGSMRMSQMDLYNFGQADVTGAIASEKLVIKSPQDTIDVDIEGIVINLGPETMRSRVDSSEFRLLSIGGTISKADVSLKNALTVKTIELDLAAKNSIDALTDRGSKRIHPLGGHLNATELVVADGQGMSLTLYNSENGFQMVPKKENQEIPVLSLNSVNKRIYVRDLTDRLILTDSNIRLGAALNSIERRQRRREAMDSVALVHPEIPRDSIMSFMREERRARRDSASIPEWMTEEDFKASDLNFTLDGIVAEYFRKWDMNGSIAVRTGILMTPSLPLRNTIKGIGMSFNNNEVIIDSVKLVSGKSELEAKGSLKGLRRALLGRGTYSLDMEFSTAKMDATEFLAALNTGAATDADAEEMANASDSEFLEMVVADSLDTTKLNALIVIPANLNADIKVNAENVKFSDLLIDGFSADVVMKERCMQIVNADASTNMGRASFEGFYATRTKSDIKTGFNLNLTDVTSEKVIAMMPAIDTIMPLLKSFKGQIDCDIAATADLDTCMNIITPSINGVIRIEGENMTMSDNDMFSDLAKKLKFKNQKRAKIDKMTVEGLIQDNVLEVFPFILDLDRYTIALSGLHNLDMSYRYHASIIRSPIVFKVGVDIYGPDFDHMKFKIGKPKYRTTDVPAFTAVIDETRLNLAESIRDIFEKGVEIAVKENEMQQAITEHKQKIGYVNAAEQGIEELTEEERRQLEEESRKAEAPAQIDSTSIANTLNEIMTIKNE